MAPCRVADDCRLESLPRTALVDMRQVLGESFVSFFDKRSEKLSLILTPATI